ncbi:IclR family transcriptional regulator C-terminal domain-containing protein [Roseibium sp. FZY0029]|uniref:IclR family transcriptional regulator n=1 Tax=Roseibium sp. FZY0029 TaxID=3116647 RepID=UPI002EB6C107|nr:IclR family transcriptional regulator C-terminal domain-containing protein [Roseibium sp. FZY0029]
MAKPIQKKQDTLFVGSLEKGLRIMSAFNAHRTELGLTELAEIVGMDKSAAQRFTNTLHKTGYLEKDPESRRFRPSLKFLELAAAYMWSDPFVQLAMPKLIDLSRDLGERVNAARPAGTDIIYVIRIPTQLTSFAAMLIGNKVQALSSSSGRIILAHMGEAERREALETWPIDKITPRTVTDRSQIAREVEEAAQQGYGIAVNQNIINEIGVAAPVFDRIGNVAGTVQCSVSSLKWPLERVHNEIAPRLMEVANSINLLR